MSNFTQIIHQACKELDVNLLRSALYAGANPNAKDEDGSTPLFYVVDRSPWFDVHRSQNINRGDRIACLEILLAAGASPNLSCTARRIDHAYENVVMDYCPYIHHAANVGDEQILSMLLAAGADVDATFYDGRTALHQAIIRTLPSLECIKVLIDAGANVNATIQGFPTAQTVGPDFYTPAQLAINLAAQMPGNPGSELAYRQRRLLPLLFSAGARVPSGPESPDAPDSEGRRYNARVLAAGGWAKYEGAHRARLTKTFASKFPSLPVEMVSKVVSYAFHTGWY